MKIQDSVEIRYAPNESIKVCIIVRRKRGGQEPAF